MSTILMWVSGKINVFEYENNLTKALLEERCVKIGNNVKMGDNVMIEYGTQIGDGAVIGDGAKLGYYSRIGKGATIAGDAKVCDFEKIPACVAIDSITTEEEIQPPYLPPHIEESSVGNDTTNEGLIDIFDYTRYEKMKDKKLHDLELEFYNIVDLLYPDGTNLSLYDTVVHALMNAVHKHLLNEK